MNWTFAGTLRYMKIQGPLRAWKWPLFDTVATLCGRKLAMLVHETYDNGKTGIAVTLIDKSGNQTVYRSKAKKEFDATQRSDP